ncbi:cellulose synthase like [Striga asiatica]|uniref:glucomannan 4-beta-mannosyltransferase n=1 Tax=Striga asiatica TaxID=4170 RepID=A0A5A7RIW3_STRAF|nr:cellulose synthase like [Striga asiatica]
MGEEVYAKSFIPEAFPVYATDVAGQFGVLWELIKAPVIVPVLNLCVYICLAMSIMVFMERLYMGVVIVLVKLFWKKPEKRYRWEPMRDADLEMGSANFPMVLVQIPMFNEKEDMVERECLRWASKGINITYQIRETRGGYKAGALKEGLKHDYVKDCEYVVIFDADFRPEPDFLRRAVPFLIHNSNIALVQARWRFVNADECLLTRMQEMSLDYHFTVEQEVGSATHAFFGFNGTGGIWRIAAINEAGGWKDRTTVEDMDLAVRAGLKGWKFLYLGDLQVKSELPSTFKAFRFQQHRWSCGPANLFRKMMMEIALNKKVTLYKKFYVIYSFFFVRKIIAHMFTFFFYCVVLPLTILVPEVYVPKWGAIYIPCIITTLNSVGTPRSFHLLFYWVLFENVMSFHRTKATIIGLLEAKRVNEWVVTEKLGDALKNKSNSKSNKPKISLSKLLGDRIQLHELGFAAFLFVCGCYDFLYGKNNYFIYLFLQVITFTIAGFGSSSGDIKSGEKNSDGNKSDERSDSDVNFLRRKIENMPGNALGMESGRKTVKTGAEEVTRLLWVVTRVVWVERIRDAFSSIFSAFSASMAISRPC